MTVWNYFKFTKALLNNLSKETRMVEGVGSLPFYFMIQVSKV